MAKDDASDIRSTLRRLKDRDIDEEIKVAKTELALNDIITERKKKECEDLKRNIEELAKKLNDLNIAIDSIPAEIIDIFLVNEQISEQKLLFSSVKEENIDFNETLNVNKDFLKRIEEFLVNFDYASYEEKAMLIKEHRESIAEFEQELKVIEVRLQHQNEKVKLLDEVPCGNKFLSCKFIKDAHETQGEIGKTRILIEDLSLNKNDVIEEVEQLEPEKIGEYLEKYDKLLERKNEVHRLVDNIRLSIEKNKTKALKIKNKLKELNDKKQEYEDNKEVIENLEDLSEQKEHIFNKHVNSEQRYNNCHEETLALYKLHGSVEQKVINLEQQKEEHEKLQNEYSSIDLYLKCMHSNGISYDIIKKKLPIINEEVAKILTNIVEFEIFFEEHGKKLEILIKHPSHDPRPIEMGSGAEKTIAAMAIRLALLNVSTLPKSDIFILDEPGTALDEENMEGFVRMLDMIKTQFKTVVLISHLDSLKDCVDSQLIIEKKDGYAHVTS
jgi:exonuclease SbcC